MRSPIRFARKLLSAGLSSEQHRAQVAALETRVRFLLTEVSELRSLVRYLLPESESFQAYMAQTRSSFDYQWGHLNWGNMRMPDPEFRKQIFGQIELQTSLPSSWFSGKRVLDAGCGAGAYTWAFGKLGASVFAYEQSAHGVETTRKLCAELPNVEVIQHNALDPLKRPEEFDLVWSHGVVHHTGDTRRALLNAAECVKPGGYLALMFYGEPRWDHLEDYQELIGYAEIRRTLTLKSFEERVTYLREHYPEQYVPGWFDAVSPTINDNHRLDEIADWLHQLGFGEVKPVLESRNPHIVARRRGEAEAVPKKPAA